jgi:DNA-binding NarL/FixJ family response regulator
VPAIRVWSPAIIEGLVAKSNGDQALSDLERAVPSGLAGGQSIHEAARAACISSDATRASLARLLMRLGICSKLEAIVEAARRGYLDLSAR